jgi:MFS family permease
VGAIFGPLLVGPIGKVALSMGFDELSGAYAASGLLFALACLTVFAWLRPDPRELGKEVARLYPDAKPDNGEARSIGQILRIPATMVAILAMALGQMVMVMVMVITALHMREHQHGLGSVSLVISAHTFGCMVSIISGGWQIVGKRPVITAATLLLLAWQRLFAPDSSLNRCF